MIGRRLLGVASVLLCLGAQGAGWFDTQVIPAGVTNVYDGAASPLFAEMIPLPDRPLFDVRAGGRLELLNVTVTGYEGCLVGLIRSAGEVFVSNCVFRACSACRGRGGVYCDFLGARGTFLNCTFDGCGALEGGVVAAEGSSVTIASSTFIGNGAITEAPAQPGGAAVVATDGAEVSVVGCTLVDQVCDANRPGEGRVIAYYGTAEVTNGTFVLNNLWRTTEDCADCTTNGVSALDWRSNRYTWDSFSHGGDSHALDGWVASNQVPREVGPVTHTLLRPCGALHDFGSSGVLYHDADWMRFALGPSEAPAGYATVCDQLGRLPARYLSGANTGNPLQRAIDTTPDGGTVRVAPGEYESVLVRTPVTIVGSDGEPSIVDGGGEDVCVLWYEGATNAVWQNFTFTNGRNIARPFACWSGNGGAWSAPPRTHAGTASNCLFTACTAWNGGGVAYAKALVACDVTSCFATGSGGGAYRVSRIDRSHFADNMADNAGAVYGYEDRPGDCLVRASLLECNYATSYTNAVSAGCSNEFCTIAKNSVYYKGMPLCGNCRFVGCLFFANTASTNAPGNVFTDCEDAARGVFVNASAGDYHLAIFDYNGERMFHLDEQIFDTNLIMRVRNEGWLDLDGRALVHDHPILVDMPPYLFMGCYAFIPIKSSGLTVTGTADWYKNSNYQTSLREAVQMAEAFGPLLGTDRVVVTFDPSLFDSSGHVTLPFGESQVEVVAFTNADQTLVIQGPTNAVVSIDGGGTFRGARVWKGNRASFENLVFTNCFGSAYGKSPQPNNNGGAIVNFGAATVSNCVFRGNHAGYTLPKPVATNYVGNGGAISTESGATTTVYAATFAGNGASKGGAIWTANGGASRVFYSTFTGNRASGISPTDANGGACAMERVNYNVKPTDLWLIHCLVNSNRVEATDGLDLGGGIYAAKDGLVLLNSVVVGNFVGASTNDIALPAVASKTSTAVFCHTAYGTRTIPKYSSWITYQDTAVTNVTDWTKAIGAFTNGAPVFAATALPHVVVPQAEGFAPETTYAWATPDFENVGYGPDRDNLTTLCGDAFWLWFLGEELLDNQVGMTQTNATGAVMIGPTTYTAPAIGGAKPPPSPYDDPDQVSEKDGVCYVVRIDGSRAYYPTVEKADRHFRPGDAVVLKDGSGLDLMKQLYYTFHDKMWDYAAVRPWYTFFYDKTGLQASLTLNEKAVPAVSSFDSGVGAERVQVRLGNVKTELFYSLGHSASPEGPWTCAEWVETKDESDLTLSAGKVGASGFYRVFVAPYVR